MAEIQNGVAPRVLVGALGNRLRGDDAVGPLVLDLLLAGPPFPPNVELREIGAPGLDLALEMQGFDALVLIDASVLEAQPGEPRMFREAEIAAMPLPDRFNPHQPALGEALLLAGHLGCRPSRVSVLAVAAAQFDFGAELSPALASRLPEYAGLLRGEIASLAAAPRPGRPGA